LTEPAAQPHPVMAEVTISGDAQWDLDDWEVAPIRDALMIEDEAERKAALREATAQLRDDARDHIEMYVEIYEPKPRGHRNVLWADTWPPEPQP
jgi:hypothetical protein